eukprot:CAMPEP_0114548494 /NCGR_PEP_ID=MMETSP0114-20121206/5010_1 /TAXON_ID=31324 /ORGANISM="Goniomonas sp, Strain m" /LENGTH=144 /DNA_ID=CAMNT_0001733085 /DNA_START=21 /DNA_END=455 /DNA_ORIENTATION=+
MSQDAGVKRSILPWNLTHVDWDNYKCIRLARRLHCGENKYTSADVDRFVKADPVHGPRVAKMQNAAMINTGSAVAGAIGSAAYLGKATRSPIGAAWGLLAGVCAGWVASEFVVTWTHGLYKFDRNDTNLAFLDFMKQNPRNPAS